MTTESNLHKRIEYLRNELSHARWLVMLLLPPRMYEVLVEELDTITNNTELHRWQRGAIDRVLAAANPESAATGSVNAQAYPTRLHCPLCGAGDPDQPNAGGFAYPDGLRRHMTGRQGAGWCAVMRMIFVVNRENLRGERQAATARA